MNEYEYDVEILYRQRSMYRVRASSREAAEAAAIERWQKGEPSSVEGYGWSEMESISTAEAADQDQLGQDAELVLRFLKERERLIQRLSAGLLNPAVNDAISAAQVASDLGWSRKPATGGSVVDVPRAAQALERLCSEQRLICFERPRVRNGERGEIRLYCTPEHLESLSSELSSLERQVG